MSDVTCRGDKKRARDAFKSFAWKKVSSFWRTRVIFLKDAGLMVGVRRGEDGLRANRGLLWL